MAQQTAVEVLFEKVFETFESYHLGKISLQEFFTILLMHRNVAIEMEKEQIIDAHYEGYRNDIGTTEVSEQYYNETFTSTPQGENPSATRIGQS